MCEPSEFSNAPAMLTTPPTDATPTAAVASAAVETTAGIAIIAAPMTLNGFLNG